MKLAKKLGAFTLASAMVVTSVPVVLANEVTTVETGITTLSLTEAEEEGVATAIDDLKEAIKDIPAEYDGTMTLKSWEAIQKELLHANELLALKFANDSSQAFVGYVTEDTDKKEVSFSYSDYKDELKKSEEAVTAANEAKKSLTKLIEAISKAEKLNADDYTGLKKVLAEAKAGLSDLQKNNQSDADADALEEKLDIVMKAKNDTAKLKEEIALAESKVKGEYTLKSYSAMMDEVKKAKEALEEKSEYTVATLTDTIKGLVEITPLKNELAKVSINNEGDYTVSSLKAYKVDIKLYQDKLNKALTNKDDDTYTAKEKVLIDAQAVATAATSLVNIKEVKTLVEEANQVGFVEADYTETSWGAYSDAKLKAQSVLLKAQDATDTQTQSTVNTAAANLKLAMYGKDADDKDVEDKGLVNIKELKVLVNAAGSVKDGDFVFTKNSSDYIEESWSGYDTAVKAANTAITTGQAALFRKAVPGLVEAIKDAEKALVPISKSTVKALLEEANAILADKGFYKISDDKKDSSYKAWEALENDVKAANEASAPNETIIKNLQDSIKGVKQYSKVASLVTLVEKANEVKELDLMPSAWEKLKGDIAAVQAVIDAKETDDKKIDEIKKELQIFDGVTTSGDGKNLEDIRTKYPLRDTTSLQKLIDEAKSITASDVEESVYLTLQDAIRVATTFKGKYSVAPTDKDKVELGKAYEALRAVMSSSVVDQAALNKLVESVKELKPENFIPTVKGRAAYKEFKEAREAANKASATAKEIVAKYKALVDAIEGLKGYELNAKVLAAKVAEIEAKGYIEYDYTVASWANLQKAIKDAKVASNQKAIHEAYEALDTAISDLEEYRVDSEVTKKVITDYYVTDATKATYTTDSWAKYVAVRNTFATKLCTVEEGSATLNSDKFREVSKLPSALRKLEADLVAAHGSLVKVGYSTLEVVIAEAETKVEADYTKETWAKFVKALDVAKATYENGTPSEVAAAEVNLRAAMAALEVVKGWVEVDGTWFYHNEDGSLAKGWTSVNGVWYFLDQTTGAMLTGWVLDGGQWYYMDAAGQMLTGWILVDGQWYYMNTSGTMTINWVLDGANWYFMNASGQMVASNWVLDNGNWYYMLADGKMATNTTVDGWEIGPNGVATQL